VAVLSAGSYASLHLDTDRSPPLSFFTGRMPFLPPNQQRQSTEGTSVDRKKKSHYSDLFALAGYFSQAVDKISAAAECRAGPSATAGAWTGWVCCVKVKVNVRR